MRLLRLFADRLRALFGRERVLGEIDEEIEAHLELLTEANRARGMAPAEARRAALASFGDRFRAQERAYDVRGGGGLEAVWQDVRHGGRMLRRSPLFTAVAVVTLALGIGANTAIFSVVSAVLLRPLPYPEAERLVRIETVQRGKGVRHNSAMPDYRAWRDQVPAFAGLAAYYEDDVNLVGAGAHPERVLGARVTANLFSVLGVAAALGRGFRPEEESFGRHRVVLLGHGLWQHRFGGDPGVVGRAINLGGESHTVVGVMPAEFPFLGGRPEVRLWTPIAFAPGDGMDTRGNHFVQVVGRLRSGVTLPAAQGQLDQVAARLERQFAENKGLGAELLDLREQLVGGARPTLLVLLGAVLLVLLVACANVASLLLARAMARERELAVRASLGAGRGRIARQLLLESVPLGLLGGLAGLLLAYAATKLLAAQLPASLPGHNPVDIDGRVLAFALGATLLTTVLFATVPALQAARRTMFAALKDGARSATTGRRRLRLRACLVAGQIGLSLMLLIGAGLMIQSFVKLRAVDLGFDGRDVLTVKVPLPDAKYPYPRELVVGDGGPPPAGRAFLARLVERVATLPGVEHVGVSTALPLGAGMGWGKLVTVDGRPPVAALDRVPLVQFALMSADYLPAMGIPVRRGRGFSSEDAASTQPVALVNETAARQLFGGQDPLGRTLWLGPPEAMLPELAALNGRWRFPRRRVVGVVADVRSQLGQPPRPEIYAPYTQSAHEGWSNGFMLAVRTRGQAAALTRAIRAEVAALDPEQPIADVAVMAARLEQSLAQPRFSTALLAVFAAAALVLAAVGVYGLMAHDVAQRTAEIGLRVALGARPGDVLWMVTRQALRLIAGGVAAGLLGALALTRTLGRLLHGVSATDPGTFASLTLFLTAVALLACLTPALRATRVPPMTALRCE